MKLFPAVTVGPGYLAQLRGPLPDVRLIPTGGIAAETIRQLDRRGRGGRGHGRLAHRRRRAGGRDRSGLRGPGRHRRGDGGRVAQGPTSGHASDAHLARLAAPTRGLVSAAIEVCQAEGGLEVIGPLREERLEARPRCAPTSQAQQRKTLEVARLLVGARGQVVVEEQQRGQRRGEVGDAHLGAGLSPSGCQERPEP